MAFNLWKVVGGSKLLLLPLTGIAIGGTGFCYGTYRIARGWSGSALGVDFDEAGTLSQGVTSIGGLCAAGGFLAVRHANYRPPPFKTVLEKMERKLHTSGQSVTHAVDSRGTIVSSTVQHARPPPPAGASVQSWSHAMRSRTMLFLHAARVPARFYFLNLFGGAVIAGVATSACQRVICGRTGSKDEVGSNFTKKFAATTRTPQTRPNSQQQERTD